MKKPILILLLTLLCVLAAGCGTTQPTVPDSASNSTAQQVPALRGPSAPSQAPVRIAVIDTGFSVNSIPQENTLEGKNYLDPQLSTADTYGHGTAVASVILEYAPEVLLVPLVSSAYDDGDIIQVGNDVLAQMIRDAVDLYACDIINISAGLVLDKDAVRQAIGYAEEQQVLVVASVGNDYPTQGAVKYYPAGYESVVAVGSLTADGTEISTFSQRGDWVDFYVAGEDISIRTLSGGTRTSEGTSYSAAKVTACAARLLQAEDGALTAAQLRTLLAAQALIQPDGTAFLPDPPYGAAK